MSLSGESDGEATPCGDYHGGWAERHRLDLYDAGRAMYGLARLLYTLENFRQTGRVVEHATSAQVKFEVEALRAGSFEIPVQQMIDAATSDEGKPFLKAGLPAILSWVTKRLKGKKIDEDEIECEKTLQKSIDATRDVALAAISALQQNNENQSNLFKAEHDELDALLQDKVKVLLAKMRPAVIDLAHPTTNGRGTSIDSVLKSKAMR